MDGIKFEFIKSAKAVYDLFSGMTLLLISDIMGKLGIGNGRTIFVVIGDCHYIHAYSISMYDTSVRGKILTPSAFEFLLFGDTGIEKSAT